MKRLLLSLALFGFVNSASAQVTVDLSTAQATIDHSKLGTPTTKPFILGTPVSAPFHISAPLHHEEKLAYYDDALPTNDNWQAPLNLGNAFAYMYGQRFTISHDEGGFLDSVRINFVLTQGNGAIFIALMHDTTAVIEGNEFQVINFSAPPIAAAQIPATSIPPNSWITLNFNKIAVPKDFFVVVLPTLEGQEFTSGVVLRGDTKPVRTVTPENSRSGVVFITSGGLVASPLDGVITFQGQSEASYTDFYMEAFPSSESSSVNRDLATPASVYPNPVIAGGMLRVNHTEAISQIRIVNALGAEVSNWNGMSSNVELPIGQIASGVYHLLITSDSGVTSEKIIVQ